MTKRSILIGIILAVLLTCVTYFNDLVMRSTFLIGNYMPIAVFGSLILFLLILNPLLHRISPRLPLTGRELAVITALVLFACYLPGRGLLHYFSTSLMLPHHHLRTKPSWQSEPAAVSRNSVRDWKRLQEILSGSSSDMPLAALQQTVQQTAAATGSAPANDEEKRWLLLKALNHVIEKTDFGFQNAGSGELTLTPYVNELMNRGRETLTNEERQHVNRGVVDSLLGDTVMSHRLGPLARAPSRMLADVSGNSSLVLDGYVTGLVQGDERLSYSDVPWRAWIRALGFWMPLIITMCIMVVGLSLVLHRQWATHERLPYPTVEFARMLLPDESSGWSPVMRNRLFWIGTVFVLAIHMNNYAYAWWPDKLIPVTTRLDLSPLLKLMPVMQRGHPWHIFTPTIFFTAVGFAFFLATDVSRSLGLAPYLYCLVAGIFAGYGVQFGGGFLRVSIESSLFAGSFFGMFVVLVYTGRHYYLSALRRGIGIHAQDPVEGSSVWGVRIFLLTFVLFVFQLSMVGMDWQLSILYLIGMIVMFTVLSRMLAEAGIFFLRASFYPCAMIWALMGAHAAGPNQLLILAMISGIMLIDTREAMMPFAMTGIQLVDRMKLRIGKTALWGTVALVLAFLAAVPVIIHLQYQRGALLVADGWSTTGVPVFPYDANVHMVRRLEAQGALDQSLSISGWQRFAEMDFDRTFLIGFAVMFALVVIFSILRHRFANWPLHPLIFLLMGTYQSRLLGFSFLLGYFIKSTVTRYGGAALYQKLKPLMIGLIAGETLAAVIPVIIGALYYAVKGEPPPRFTVLPG